MTKGRATTLEERIEIVTYCIEQGKNYGAAIERYQVSYQQVYSWVNKYEHSGVSGLADKRGKHKKLEEMTEIEPLRAENRLLQATNKRKDMEIALLTNCGRSKGGEAERSEAGGAVYRRFRASPGGRVRGRGIMRACEPEPLLLLQMDETRKERVNWSAGNSCTGSAIPTRSTTESTAIAG
ncbi:transposase [Bacillota bacterium Meth-B3]